MRPRSLKTENTSPACPLRLSLIHILIRVLKEQYEQTLQILTRWQGALETLAGELIRRETLSGEEFMEIWTRVLDII